MIELARTRFGWELLSYEPPFVDVYLAEYERLVRDYRPPVGPVEPARMWDPAPEDAAFRRCLRHGLFLGDYTDCRLCL